MSPHTGEISVQLIINTAAPKADFRQLFAQKEEIEVEAKEQFEWREAPEKVQKRIELRRRATPNNEATWPELFEWLMTKLELIHGVFGPRVKSLTLADPDDSDAAQL